MVDGLPILELTARALVALVCLLVLTDRLVWHKRLKAVEDRAAADVARAEADRDEWKHYALELLGVANKLTVHAEVANEVLTRLPDPEQEADRS